MPYQKSPPKVRASGKEDEVATLNYHLLRHFCLCCHGQRTSDDQRDSKTCQGFLWFSSSTSCIQADPVQGWIHPQAQCRRCLIVRCQVSRLAPGHHGGAAGGGGQAPVPRQEEPPPSGHFLWRLYRFDSSLVNLPASHDHCRPH